MSGAGAGAGSGVSFGMKENGVSGEAPGCMKQAVSVQSLALSPIRCLI